MLSRILSLCCFVVLFAGQGNCADDATLLDIDHLNILAFGDSITQGLARDYDGEGGYYVWGILEPPLGRSVGKKWGYEWHLESIVEAELPLPATIYNWGHMGFTSVDALDCINKPKNCLDTVLSSYTAEHVQMILILFGTNDLAGISVTTTQFNLEQLIDKSRSRGIEPVLGTILPNTNKRFTNPDIVEGVYNPMIRAVAADKKVLLADHYLEMVDDWESLYTSGDGIHLGDAGNQRMARTWYTTILESDIFKPPSIVSILNLLLPGH